LLSPRFVPLSQSGSSAIFGSAGCGCTPEAWIKTFQRHSELDLASLTTAG
jgi:hypothetical protein